MADYPSFNPVATPRQTNALPGRPIEGPAPLAPMPTVAPQVLTRPAAAPRTIGEEQGVLDGLFQSLKGMSPQLDKLFGEYYAEVHKEDQKNADADATQAALKSNVETWAKAVEADPTLADKSPWYRQIYEARLATSAVQRQAGQVMERYYSSSLAGSSDPGAVRPWLQDQFKDALTPFSSPAARAAAADELRKVSEQFITAHQSNAARNLVHQNQDSFSSALGLSLDKWAATDGKNMQALSATWQQLETAARAQGVDGRTINEIEAKSLSTGMIRLGRQDIRTIGEQARPDGTPGFSTTATGRAELVRASDHLLTRQTQLENLAYTREQRARATTDRNIEGNLADYMVEQMRNGQAPRLDPAQLAGFARSNPEAVTKALAMQRAMTTFNQEEDPKFVAAAMAPFYAGAGSVEDVAALAASGRFSPSSVQKLYELARQNQQDDGLKAVGVTTMIEETSKIVGEAAPITGVLQEPVKGAAAANAMRAAAIKFHTENPTAGPADILAHLRKVQPDVIAAFRPGFPTESLEQRNFPGANERRNNPNNLQNPGWKPGDPRPRFASYSAMEDGIAASLRQFQIYQSRDSKFSIRDMIEKATPPASRGGDNSDAGVARYIAAVSREIGIAPDAPVNLQDPATAAAFLQAVWRQEGGRPDLNAVARGVLKVLPGGRESAAAVASQPAPNVQPASPSPAPTPVPAPAPTPAPTPAAPSPPARTAQQPSEPPPVAGANWRTTPLFSSGEALEAALQQEVKGGGSPLLREWFSKLGIHTPETQRSFIATQRAMFRRN